MAAIGWTLKIRRPIRVAMIRAAATTIVRVVAGGVSKCYFFYFTLLLDHNFHHHLSPQLTQFDPEIHLKLSEEISENIADT